MTRYRARLIAFGLGAFAVLALVSGVAEMFGRGAAVVTYLLAGGLLAYVVMIRS